MLPRMSQPPPYTRSFSYTNFGENYPTAQPPGVSTDAEFDAVATTLSAVRANLAKLQRDDGALLNKIVTLDSLSDAALLTLGAGSTWVPRGAWVIATAYAARDVVTNGTGTYVAPAAHTAGSSFSADLALGRWIKINDDAGSTPADASVTNAKIADGAIDQRTLGLTTMTLTGLITAPRFAAGTGSASILFHGKAATGDAYARVERTTLAQGAVGFQVYGATTNFTIGMATNNADLTITGSTGLSVRFTGQGGVDVAGGVRAVAGIQPTSGAGVDMTYFAGGYAQVSSYDYSNLAWKDLGLAGKVVTISGSSVTVLTATSAGVDFPVDATLRSIPIGYLGLPQNIRSTSYTLTAADAGGHVFSQNVAGQTITIPTNAAVAFPIGTTIVIINDGTNAITISTTGITLAQAGTSNTGNRNLAARGMASLVKVGTDRWFITGSGIA
jgi:hypothetical protein